MLTKVIIQARCASDWMLTSMTYSLALRVGIFELVVVFENGKSIMN